MVFNPVGPPRIVTSEFENFLLQVLCSILNRDTSFDFVSELNVSGKIFSFSMLIGGYLLLSCYCAVLISYLTVGERLNVLIGLSLNIRTFFIIQGDT